MAWEPPPPPAPFPLPPDACLGCGTPLHYIGIEEFRIGGTSGGWKIFLGEWSEIGEQKIALEVLACPVCRRVEMRIPPRR